MTFFKECKRVLDKFSWQEEVKSEFGYISDDNIVMFIPKTQELIELSERILTKYKVKPKNFNYNTQSGNECRYAPLILNPIFKMIEKHPDVKISVAHNFPMKIETSQCIFIIAPRVEV